MADAILLITFYALSIYNRKELGKHMRFMIGTALVFLGPTLGRIGPILLGLSENITQHGIYAVIYLILLLLILADKKYGFNYKAYLVIGSGWALHQFFFVLLF